MKALRCFSVSLCGGDTLPSDGPEDDVVREKILSVTVSVLRPADCQPLALHTGVGDHTAQLGSPQPPVSQVVLQLGLLLGVAVVRGAETGSDGGPRVSLGLGQPAPRLGDDRVVRVAQDDVGGETLSVGAQLSSTGLPPLVEQADLALVTGLSLGDVLPGELRTVRHIPAEETPTGVAPDSPGLQLPSSHHQFPLRLRLEGEDEVLPGVCPVSLHPAVVAVVVEVEVAELGVAAAEPRLAPRHRPAGRLRGHRQAVQGGGGVVAASDRLGASGD